MYLIYQKDNLPRTIFEIVFKNTGSIYAKDGVANFLAHMLNTKGTLLHAQKFYSLLEEKAINLSVSANREFISLNMGFLNEKSSTALKYLLNLLEEPNLSKKAFEQSKKEIISKKESLQNNNDYIAHSNLFKAAFKDTPLEKPVIGENIEDITLEDIKKHFQRLSDIVIINGGKKIDIDFIEILPKTKTKELFFTPQKSFIKTQKESEQAYIYFLAPFNVTKDYHLAKIATFILGAGGFGSRIMEEVRVKRGYAYSAYAVNEFKRSYKILKGHLQTKLENQQSAMELIKDIINEYIQKGATKKELESAKKFLIGSEPLRQETLKQRLMLKFNEYYLDFKEGYFKKELELIQNTTLDELNEFIKNHPEISELSFSVVSK
ncbi:MAG: insulinase family protein [Epsilonproteobacteria bacterium]|nr:insulinase family protein [Campylobacterota bacterium]